MTKDKTTGFTLIEAAIAILLLVIILTGGMAYFFYANSALQVANHRRIAAEMAQSTMEQIKSANYTTLAAWSGVSNVAIGNLSGVKNISVSGDIADGQCFYKQITVNITWSQPDKSVPGEVVLDTYIMKPE